MSGVQLARLREGRRCLHLPRPRRLSDAVRMDIAVIVGALVVLAIGLWLRVPIIEDAVLLVLSAIAGLSGVWAVWCAIRTAWGRE